MGIFGKKKTAPAAAPVAASTPVSPVAAPVQAPTPAPAVDMGKKTGSINLTKGSRVTIEKTPIIRARTTWSSSTDYDLYALVLTTDGKVHTVSMFGTEEDPSGWSQSILGGSIRHLGDVTSGSAGQAEEIIEIKLTPEIVAVVPVAYSARSNGSGSFKRYKVSLSIDNGAGTQVSVSADNASNNNTVYTVAIGAIRNTPEGVVIEALESYSAPGSERRPVLLADGRVSMDAGPVNDYK